METLNVGIIGTGNIAPAYIQGCAPFDVIKLTACADILADRAQAFGAEHGLTAYSVDDLLGRDDIDIVINLTIPAAHAEVSLQIIEAGKHAYVEKPLAVNREDGEAVIKAAAAAGLRMGCAPDTFFGGGGQTARKAIDDGVIGEPIAATATWLSHGHESWHPNAGFYYLEGGGPMLDMGPYYVTALLNLMGPVARVAGSARMTFAERIATSEALKGQRLPVEVNTHVAGTLEFESGAIATVIMSFDVWGHNLPLIEIHGSEGSLSVPDPNRFDGDVSVVKGGSREWVDIPLTHTTNTGRGAGVADMAYAILSGRPHRASGDLAFHALEIMLALEESSEQGRHIEIKSTLEQPLAVPAGLPDGVLDM
ncbi:MAG: Gfo/Idh/MocA family oxidoreductase [Chloroflexota bacterium]|nr:Gfo/Idh/MocA family oxidoreductase [Chloroflexota bacterium]MDE2909023.1 Gfo/Idh/MocA family oxidoreductase [Chloroflexota bacterium]